MLTAREIEELDSSVVQAVFNRALPQHQWDALQALAHEYWEGGADMSQEGASVHATPGDPDGIKQYTREHNQIDEVITACELLQEALVSMYAGSDYEIMEGIAPF